MTKPPLGAALAHLDRATRSGEVAAAVLHVEVKGQRHHHAFGQAKPDTIFLLASITKPMSAAAIMTMVEEGRLGLDDPAARYLPELAGGDRPLITIRHLLNHTSGLPDQLPDNLELRRRQAPVSDFLAGALRAPLRFRPGSNVAYQSMGFLLAATIAERLAKLPFREQLRRRLFQPLGMETASLGLGGRPSAALARCQVPDDPGGWNSPYWRDFGAPWGGAHGSSSDVIRLLQFFARPERQKGPLRPESARAMRTQTTPPGKKERYGLGWRLGPAGHGRSESTFGHSGATGTLAWVDPARELAFVLLTTSPADRSEATVLRPVSDLVSGAF